MVPVWRQMQSEIFLLLLLLLLPRILQVAARDLQTGLLAVIWHRSFQAQDDDERGHMEKVLVGRGQKCDYAVYAAVKSGKKR